MKSHVSIHRRVQTHRIDISTIPVVDNDALVMV